MADIWKMVAWLLQEHFGWFLVVCAVAAVWPDGRECTARGVLEGRIATEQSGFNGFGYDPIFFLPEYGMTSGQIPREEKNRISHRGQAFRKLGEILIRELSGDSE